MSKNWLFSLAFLAHFSVYAGEAATDSPIIQIPSHWQSQIELGYQAHSGNSDSQAINTRVKGEYIRGRHRTNGEWRFHKLDKNGKENKRQSRYSIQTDYKLGPKAYLYGSFRGSDSRYSAYFTDYTWSGGLGYQLTNTDDLLIELELGPGYRYQEPNLDKIGSSDIVFPHLVKEPIYRGNLKVEWQVLKNFKLLTDLTMVGGDSNTRLDSDISIINNITDNIALKITQTRQYHNRVPKGLSKADSVMSVNLVFLF